MKKSNFVSLLTLIVLIVVVITFMFFKKTPNSNNNNNSVSFLSKSNIVSTTDSKIKNNKNYSKNSNTISEVKPSENHSDKPQDVNLSMKNTLFIGDSRTVGLMEYAGIKDADFFCTVGMSVHNIHKKPISVPNVGKVTLTELLNNKKYDKIYIMLGINEVGYKTESTVNSYSELLDFIKNKQPDSTIFIQANLHVTKKRSDTDKIVNNGAINELNTRLSTLADEKSIFYLDANSIFDDANGGLSADKSEDSTHLYAKWYSEWGKWIIRQTESLTKEG